MRQATRTLLGLAAAAAIILAVSAEDVDDSKFLLDAITTDIAEIKLGALAAERASSNAVREYGKKLEADHSHSLQETSVLAETLGVTIPTEPTAEALEHYAALEKLSAAEFDAAFVNHMIVGHKEAIAKFSEQTHANPNKEIMALATKALPTLQAHLATAESLQKAAGGTTRTDPHLRHEGQTSSTPAR